MVEKIGAVVIFDFTGDSARESGGIESSDGGDSADSLFDGLPKSLNPNADGTDDS
jgi:hypothetical protein